MKIILIGERGMLGAEFAGVLAGTGHTVYGFDVHNCDITDIMSVEAALSGLSGIDYLINCAAYTNVDQAEVERERAFQLNVEGVSHLAQFCLTRQIPMIHFSTDYVFNPTAGQTDFKLAPTLFLNETNPTDPINYYGYTKLESERVLQTILERFYIFRIQWLYGQHGKNFVSTILNKAKEVQELKIVSDQWGTPTWTKTVVECVIRMLELKAPFGIYHLANTGYTTWYEFAKFFLEYQKIQTQVVPITSTEFKSLAKRPYNSCFNLHKYLQVKGALVPIDWQSAVREFLKP